MLFLFYTPCQVAFDAGMRRNQSDLNGTLRPAVIFSGLGWLMGMMLVTWPVACARPAEVAATASLNQVLRAYVESGRVPGVVAVAATGDRVLHEGAFGRADLESEEPLKLDALFRIASMAKPITSVAVMQLMEQGKVSLGASADRYLPELAKLKVLEGFDDQGQPRLRNAARPPTIRELLSNTSGYAYTGWNEDMRRYLDMERKAGRGVTALDYPLVSDPGTRWEYGPSTRVLGLIVEKISGANLEEYFREHIFIPLGMNDTLYQVPADKWSRITRLHARQQNGGVAISGPKPGPNPPQVRQFHGDGGLVSTGPDYLRFVRAMVRGGELDGARILKEETVDLMGRNHIGGFRAGEMISASPELSYDVHLFPGATNKFGYGFLLNAEPVTGGRAAGSLMWAGAFNTYFWIDRTQGVGGVVMTQIRPFADPVVLQLLEAYEKAVYALPR